MTEKEINESNRIIAEFMGCRGRNIWCANEEVLRYGFATTHITELWHESMFNEMTPYHTDLNWLMEVVEEIRGIGLGCMITVNLFSEQIGKPTEVRIYIPEIGQSEIVVEKQSFIEAMWLAVVSFINWHNQTTTDKGRVE